MNIKPLVLQAIFIISLKFSNYPEYTRYFISAQFTVYIISLIIYSVNKSSL